MFLACLLGLINAGWSAADNAAPEGDESAKFLRDHRSDIVLIKGKAGSGSGFIAEMKGHKFLVSNAHVLASIRAPSFTLLDRTPLKLRPGAASVAVGHDLVVFEVLEGGTGMSILGSVDKDTAVGDAIAVLGNPGSGDVVTVLKGELLGIGPTRIEISAQIERGNSGSPIIQLASGKVIGVATFAVADELLSGKKKVRRFGYRLDSVKQWQAIDWVRFYNEADTLGKIQTTTAELKRAFIEINTPKPDYSVKRRKYVYDSPAIRSALDNFYATMSSARYRADADRAVSTLLSALRAASQSNVATAKSSFTYDFFRRQVTEQESDRAEVMKLFVKLLEQ
jgi:hypothetical protein